jgi:hypothetical protein
MLDTSERQRFDLRFAEIRQIDPAKIILPAERSRHSIKDVGVGGVLRFEGKNYRVTATGVYRETDDSFRREKQYFVTELTLFCLENGETHFIEWEIDDRLEVCFTTRELAAKALCYDNREAVSFDDMDEMAEEEETLVLDGVTYDYDDDWSAKWRASDGRSSCVFMVEFGNARAGWITIEGWSDDGEENGDWEYQAFHSVDVAPTSIELISLGEKGSADDRAV